MKTDLFVWGRPDEGPWSTVCPGSWPGCRRHRGVGRGGGADIAPFIITSNHYGNSVVKMYREVGAYCIRPI